MFQKGQNISYVNDGIVVSELSETNIDLLDKNIARYLRYPSVMLNYMFLLIPIVVRKIFLGDKALPVENVAYGLQLAWVRREGNKLTCKSGNSTVEMIYTNIDLERILLEGGKDVISKQDKLPPFPYPT